MSDHMLINKYRNNLLSLLGMNRTIVRASGHSLFDSDGNEIIDFLAQYGAVPFGHSPEFINRAVIEYLSAEKPIFVQPLRADSTKQLAKQLCRLAGDEYDFTVFTNSGAETVEAAIKLARMKTERACVLSLVNSFHGKTYVSLSATGSDKYHAADIVDSDKFSKVALNDTAGLEAELSTGKYAALLVELVQGEGGMQLVSQEFISSAQTLCEKFGTLLVVDEIQTGLGRTGYMFASQKFNISPDIILLSKALGGGAYPIGALIVKASSYHKEFDKKHSSTFANGGLAAHVAQTVVTYLEDNPSFLDNVKHKSSVIEQHLQRLAETYPGTFTYTGTGLMYALRFRDAISPSNFVVEYCQRQDLLSYIVAGYLINNHNMLCMPFLGNVDGAIRFEPSLSIELERVEQFLGALEEVVRIIHFRRYDILMAYTIGKSISDEYKAAALASDHLNEPFIPGEDPDPNLPRFAFLFHVTGKDDMAHNVPYALKQYYTKQECLEVTQWMADVGAVESQPDTVCRVTMQSITGQKVNGVLIYSPISAADMLLLPERDRKRLIQEYLDVAEEEQVDVVGLGAYTSVISEAGLEIETDKFRLTTGNSLTAMVTAHAAIHHAGEEVANKKVMVIGARGSVGRIVLLELMCHFRNVYLIGSQRSGLEVLKVALSTAIAELIRADIVPREGSALAVCLKILTSRYPDPNALADYLDESPVEVYNQLVSECQAAGLEAPFRMSLDVTDLTHDVDSVISVTSTGKPFLSSAIFKPGTKVFDAARPFDVKRDDNDQVKIFEGGLVSQPGNVMFGDSNLVGYVPGVNLACLSETILLTMEKVDRHYSLGRSITYSEASDVYKMAQKHGFAPYLFDTEHKLDILQD